MLFTLWNPETADNYTETDENKRTYTDDPEWEDKQIRETDAANV